MKIALIIGHTKHSKGASNKSKNLYEFDFNQELSTRILDISKTINDIDFIVIYRDTYSKLPGAVNRQDVDIAISMHCNAYNESASGTETLYYHTSTRGKQLAGNMNYQFNKALGLKNRGIKAKTSEDRGGFLLRYTSAPCVIAEPFFIDNDDDLDKALESIDDLAHAYVDGCVDYMTGIVRNV